jgi:hypothetical protein
MPGFGFSIEVGGTNDNASAPSTESKTFDSSLSKFDSSVLTFDMQ